MSHATPFDPRRGVRARLPIAIVLAALTLALSTAFAPAGTAESGRPPPGATEARDLPEGEAAGALPDGVEPRDVPEPKPSRALPDEGVEPRSGPVDPPAVRPPAATGELLPAPLDAPIPDDADRDPEFWKRRRERAEDELARIRRERRATEDDFTQACRYVGGDRCDALREKAWALHRQEVALEGYLEDGLRDDCRRAGCLPGWVRD